MSITLIRIGLFLLAVLSPLLTFATLWQIKEWRIDRLKEHLRSEGYIRQLIGILRPVILVITLLSLQLTHLPTYAYIDACIAVMAGMALLQIIGRKQRYPRWTLKAMLLVLGALCINLALITLLHNNNWTLVGSLLAQPVILALVWALFLPIDRIMKRQMMQKAASLRQTYKNMMVIGITGSVGKTTTKELIAHLLAEKDIIFTPAYVNSEMGVSKWLLSELPRHSTDDALIAIIEMGAYRKGEIARLCGITQPTMGMITYIGSQHIALFGSQDALCNAKAELVQYLPQTGVAFINGDNELCQKALAHTKAKHIVVGTGGHADKEAFDIEETGTGISFRVDNVQIHVPLHGTHNVTNVLLAIAVAQELGMDTQAIAKRLNTFTPPSATFSIRSERGITILDDTHNASPESFRAAIAWAASQPIKQKVLLTPGLIELGNLEQTIHRELGSQAAPVFDRIIVTSKKHAAMLEEGYGKPVELLSSKTKPLAAGDLLVCEGRVKPSSIQSLLV